MRNFNVIDSNLNYMMMAVIEDEEFFHCINSVDWKTKTKTSSAA